VPSDRRRSHEHHLRADHCHFHQSCSCASTGVHVPHQQNGQRAQAVCAANELCRALIMQWPILDIAVLAAGMHHLVSGGLPGGSHWLPQRPFQCSQSGEGSFPDVTSVLDHFRARLSLRCFGLLFRRVVSAFFRSRCMLYDICMRYEAYSALW